jgi:hypothetical protein
MLVRTASLLKRLASIAIPRADSKLALLDCLRAGGGGGAGPASEACDVDLARPWITTVSGFEGAVAVSGLIMLALPVRRVGGGGGPIFWGVGVSAMLGG